ncbi:hypothetical protein HJG54_22740 [Leptolyngbya sp. NK1-12]|uniref:Uncharacterized protein n=1 Tax=Leptolyngbya sp. NK1-12 TaxID=2547451 RepID=A0AA96WHV3_9CYAN|nr:hypothetical protein [Leptolyngbya sp. NK1-12]WNZ25389.1 hypothetical protein HJG54_22740 [Leptolyngbya sp. NK1-12]
MSPSQTQTFNPLRTEPGEFRVALLVSELGDKALEILKLAESLGFANPKFVTYTRLSGVVEVWAILLQQFHRYDADPSLVVDVWDEQLEQLWQACEPAAHTKLLIASNLQDCKTT